MDATGEARECAKRLVKSGARVAVVLATRPRLTVFAISDVQPDISACREIVDVIVAPWEAVEADAVYGEAGDLVALNLLLAPLEVHGDVECYETLSRRYARRVVVEELSRMKRMLGTVYERLRMAPHAPLVARMARLARLYPWLRTSFNNALNMAEGVSRLQRLAIEASGDIYKPVIGYRIVSPAPPPEARRRVHPRKYLEAFNFYIDASRILDGLSARLHPLLRDPWLLVRLDHARIATRLLAFEDQLYNLTGVARAIREVKKAGTARAAKIVKGFRPAVVKHYTSPIAAKWVVASILTLHLPRPRLHPRPRLLAEYEYTVKLMEKGFRVPEPILVDPRRYKAAYTYIEGENLIEMLKKTPAPPQYRDMGCLLAQVHSEGVALWDANPSNFVYAKTGELYLVDLEQARETRELEEYAWDMAVACYYSGLYAPHQLTTRVKMIVNGYLECGGSKEVVLEASRTRYMTPFLTAIAPNILERARRTMRRTALS